MGLLNMPSKEKIEEIVKKIQSDPGLIKKFETEPIKAIEGYRAHRKERLAEVTRIIDGGAGFDPDAVVQGVYGDIADPMLLRASLASTVTQLEYLAKQRGVEFHFDPEEFNRRFPNLSQT